MVMLYLRDCYIWIIIKRHKKTVFAAYSLFLLLLNLLLIRDGVFWGDELYSIHGIKMDGIINLLKYLANGEIDIYPPLYYIFARVICGFFGYNGFVFRLVSLIPLLGLLFVSWFFISEEFGYGTAALFSTFCAILRTAMSHNVEVRAYSLASCMVFLSYYSLYKAMKCDNLRYYVLFPLFSVLAAYSHYFALLSVSFFYIGLLLWVVILHRKLWKVFLSFFLSIILYLPWLLAFWSGFLSKGKEQSWLSATGTFFECMDYIFEGRLYSLPLFILFLVESFLVLYDGYRCFGNKHGLDDHERVVFPVWILFGVVSVFGTAVIGIAASELSPHPFFFSKYMYPVSIIAWFVLAAAPTQLKHRWVYIGVFLAVMLTIGMAYYVKFFINVNNDYAEERKTLDALEGMSNEDIIILCNWGDGLVMEAYFPENSFILAEDNDKPIEDKSGTIWVLSNDLKSAEDYVRGQNCYYEEILENGTIGLSNVQIGKMIVDGDKKNNY